MGASGQQQLSEWVREEDTAHRTCRERNRAQGIGRIGPLLALPQGPVPGWFTNTLNPCHLWGQKSWQNAPGKVRAEERNREGRRVRWSWRRGFRV